MSVRLTDDEGWEVLRTSHTGILTTLRRDGTPVSLPVWFVVDDHAVLVAGPAASHKFSRLGRDPRVVFLVESGQAWRELQAVHLTGVGEVVESPDWGTVDLMFDAKYADFRTPRSAMPASARKHYDAGRALVRITPTEPFISWDNRRLETR